MNDSPYIKMLNNYLSFMAKNGGSDLHLKANALPRMRVQGEIKIISNKPLTADDMENIAKDLLSKERHEAFKKTKNSDLSYKLDENYRFRINLFHQLDGVSAVFRVIPGKIPDFKTMNLPPILEKIINDTKQGIVLLTGPTGSGKTTTLASMVNHINNTKYEHIVTIEDPIEFVYKDNLSLINQRSVGESCTDFSSALRAALREDPDVVLVGEMRDLETIEIALKAAETGHLVLSTVHTISAKDTVSRIIGMFPTEEQPRIRMTMSAVLRAIVSQRLCKKVGGGRIAACEILINNTRIRDIIIESRDHEINDAIAESKNSFGMQTFDQHLVDLYEGEFITREEALEKASNRNDLELMLKNNDLARRVESGDTSILEDDVLELKDLV